VKNFVLRSCLFSVALAASSGPHALEIDYNVTRATELRECDNLLYRGRNDEARDCYNEVFGNARNNTIRGLAAWALGDLSAANVLFRSATQRDPQSVLTRVAWGRLFIATHQHDDALKLFREALSSDPSNIQAKLGMAQIFAQRFEGQARKIVDEVLAQDDQAVEAHVLLARMNVEEGHLAEAEKNLDRAQSLAEKLQLAPLEIYALRAALDWQRGDDGDKWVKRALAYNPRYGGVYATVAHFEVMRRRYREAAELLRKAVAIEPELAEAQAELGNNLLRLGQIEEGQKHLALAYERDPYSVTTVNTLRLLDRFNEFNEIGADGGLTPLHLRLHRTEAEVLRPYVEQLSRESIEAFAKRYRFTPKQPITIEFYPNHDDFAVRIGGLPGIGLLGVTFGYLVAMDSPSGRATGEFHWGSTLWHEMAHVFTLAATDHRVPRWLSEGISVFEEWRTGPTPGVAVPFEVLAAFQDGRFLKIEDLDGGFIRPTYENQVQISYMQAGLICLFIEQRYGFDKLVALLDQYKRDVTVAAAVKGGLGVSTSEFDKSFNEFMKQRYAKALPHLKEWQEQYTKATEAAERGDWSDVIEPARAAIDIHPEQVDAASPYLILAKAYEETKQSDRALQTLLAFRAAGGWDPDALRKLAKELLARNRNAEAIEVLAAVNYGDPLKSETHLQLADALLAAQRPQEAAREYRAMLALDTHDKATAYFGVARALRGMGDAAGSRRNVLQALEAAPHYRPAQDLLLEMIDTQ
jgi:tetratricopeptide (TPR) repeat protein